MKPLAIDYSQDEKLIAETILEARKVQEYLWQDLSLLYYPYDPSTWRDVFQKRLDKINDLDINNPNFKVELRKRILQQGALSVLALRILDNNDF